MKKLIAFLGTFLLVASGCAGGNNTEGGAENNKGEITLEIFSNMTQQHEKDELNDIISEFEEENSDIKVDISYPAGDYEDLLRVKMGANEMPDLFDTHGWSTSLYSDFTKDLKDMDWTEHLAPELEPIITDDEGKVHTYPLNQAKDGILFSESIIEEYDIDLPTNFDEFMEALHTVKEKSNGEIVPFWIPGKDNGNIGQVFDQFATPLLVTDETENYEKELLDGSFDWSNYTLLPEKIKEMQEEGLLNEDVLTADKAQGIQLFAEQKIAFSILTGSIGQDVTKANPDEKLGVIPVPAFHEGDDPSWIGGERFTFSIWKDSDKINEAEKFIDFISQPENAKRITEATSYPNALTNVDVDMYYDKYYDELFDDVRLEMYFDRVYLPDGMWDVLGHTGQNLLADTLTPEQVSKEMEEEYHRLRED